VAEKEYFIALTEEDRVATKIVTRQPKDVVHYSLQLETYLADSDEWVAIRRYDCSHNVVHTHTFGADGQDQRTEQRGVGFKEGLELARSDLRGNWTIYKRTYLEGRARFWKATSSSRRT
jgi:hypothetical protein